MKSWLKFSIIFFACFISTAATGLAHHVSGTIFFQNGKSLKFFGSSGLSTVQYVKNGPFRFDNSYNFQVIQQGQVKEISLNNLEYLEIVEYRRGKYRVSKEPREFVDYLNTGTIVQLRTKNGLTLNVPLVMQSPDPVGKNPFVYGIHCCYDYTEFDKVEGARKIETRCESIPFLSEDLMGQNNISGVVFD
jgi:hypothetical protein